MYKAETDGVVSAYTNGGSDGLRINIGDEPTPVLSPRAGEHVATTAQWPLCPRAIIGSSSQTIKGEMSVSRGCRSDNDLRQQNEPQRLTSCRICSACPPCGSLRGIGQEGKSANCYSVLGSRKPTAKLRSPRSEPSRLDAPQKRAELNQLPPRWTRSEPDTGPAGSVTVPPE